ncbi:hypothetical protein [Yinghuangia aomiensis]|uniref:hypothetical protein n=1 Tax=Yinghuangia aomiensis TaxID=676205 RepID=UPI0031EF079B
MPYSDTAGPARRKDDVVRCFAHTPTGALIAVVQISVRLTVSRDRRSVLMQSATGTQRDQALAAPTTAPRQPQASGELTGFQFLSYTDDAATLMLVRTSSGGLTTASLYAVSWSDGDWKLQVQPDGSAAVMTERDTQPAGVIGWSPEGAR